MNRRTLVILLGTTAAATALLPLLPFESLAGRPRYRSRKGKNLRFPRQTQVLYLNRKSGKIHYRVLKNRNPSVSQITLANYEVLTFDEAVKRVKAQEESWAKWNEEGGPMPPGPSLEFVDFEYILEQLTLEHIRGKRYDEARAFLRGNLAGQFSLGGRLYDLLAALTVRFGKDEDYENFIAAVSSVKVSDSDKAAPKWNERVSKWKNKEGKWYKKWKDRGKQLSWAGLLM
ncbi:MAG TPA: hypothetical protein VD861_02055 [Pyrinomonadaceae bacterium]|nr:hypothetical protein [Pyrinomonadaceae bacterium]